MGAGNAGNGGKKANGGKDKGKEKNKKNGNGKRIGRGNGEDNTLKPKFEDLQSCEFYSLILGAVRDLSEEHKVSLEDILTHLKKSHEFPATDCQLYVAIEQHLIKAVSCGHVCVRMNRYYYQGMQPPSNLELKGTHCHLKPFPPPACSEDGESSDEEDPLSKLVGNGKKDVPGISGPGVGGPGAGVGGPGAGVGGPGAGVGGPGAGVGGPGAGVGGPGAGVISQGIGKGDDGDGSGGKKGEPAGGKGGGDKDGKGEKGGIGGPKCKCQCVCGGKDKSALPEGGKSSLTKVKKGTPSKVGKGPLSKGDNKPPKCEKEEKCEKEDKCEKDAKRDKEERCCKKVKPVEEDKCDEEELHLNHLSLRRASFKPEKSPKMRNLHPKFRQKIINCIRQTPPSLYNYRGPTREDGVTPAIRQRASAPTCPPNMQYASQPRFPEYMRHSSPMSPAFARAPSTITSPVFTPCAPPCPARTPFARDSPPMNLRFAQRNATPPMNPAYARPVPPPVNPLCIHRLPSVNPSYARTAPSPVNSFSRRGPPPVNYTYARPAQLPEYPLAQQFSLSGNPGLARPSPPSVNSVHVNPRMQSHSTPSFEYNCASFDAYQSQ